MGWIWKDEPSDSSSSSSSWGGIRGTGELDTHNPNSTEEDKCSTRRMVKSSCRTEEVEPGRYVRKCDKTEQILRDCVGRPVEVVESKTEHTEDDVTDEVKRGSLPFESLGNEPFAFPGFRNDIEALERSMVGGLGQFVHAAEEMANDFFQSFGIQSRQDRESSPFIRRIPMDEQLEKNAPKTQRNESEYAEISGQIRDV